MLTIWVCGKTVPDFEETGVSQWVCDGFRSESGLVVSEFVVVVYSRDARRHIMR
jgi:hypothetical protein